MDGRLGRAMVTFAELLENNASKREFVNMLFEERIFRTYRHAAGVVGAASEGGVPHELVGGPAVFLHVENAGFTHSSLTRNIDILVRRSDLNRVVTIAADHGFRFRHSAGLDMLIFGQTNSAWNAIDLLSRARR